MKLLLDILFFSFVLWVFGLFFTLLMVMGGYQGGDMMSEHYRSVLQGALK